MREVRRTWRLRNEKCVMASSDAKVLLWNGVDYVIESTTLFVGADTAKGHIEAGAKQVCAW